MRGSNSYGSLAARRGSLLVIVFLLALWLPLAIQLLAGGNQRTNSGSGKPGPVDVNGSIIANGTKVSLAAAQSQAPFPLSRPQDPLASDASLKAVWFSERPMQVGLQYESGIRIYLRPSELGDPVNWYEGQRSQGANGTIQTINGVQAFVIPQDKQEPMPGSVDMVLDGIEVAIIGGGDFTVEELTRIAGSVSS
jgi:hypothetical protein